MYVCRIPDTEVYYELDYLQVKDILNLVTVIVFIIFASQGVFYNYNNYITVEVLVDYLFLKDINKVFVCIYDPFQSVFSSDIHIVV